MSEKVVIAGPRDLDVGWGIVAAALESIGMNVRTGGFSIIAGCASGVDSSALGLAEYLDIPHRKREARWNYWRAKGNVRRAGPERNGWMADEGTRLLIIRDTGRRTSGTNDIIKQFQQREKPVNVFEVIPGKSYQQHEPPGGLSRDDFRVHLRERKGSRGKSRNNSDSRRDRVRGGGGRKVAVSEQGGD